MVKSTSQWVLDLLNSFNFFTKHLGTKKSSIMHQSIPAAPSTPRATAGHLPALSVPGVGHLQILRCLGAGHWPTPGPFLSFWHARSLLSENNYTEDFTGKESRLAHLSRTGKIEEVCKGMFLILCMHFFIAYQFVLAWLAREKLRSRVLS